MARTMKWPPVPEGGRIPMVEGVDASTILVVQTLSDLQTNPFNDALLSLGNVAFQPVSQARARIKNALKRLTRVIEVQNIVENKNTEDGDVEYVVQFTDRETRTKAEANVNG